jgi:hypothetical protein
MKIWVVKIHADIDCNDRKGLKCIEYVIQILQPPSHPKKNLLENKIAFKEN